MSEGPARGESDYSDTSSWGAGAPRAAATGPVAPSSCTWRPARLGGRACNPGKEGDHSENKSITNRSTCTGIFLRRQPALCAEGLAALHPAAGRQSWSYQSLQGRSRRSPQPQGPAAKQSWDLLVDSSALARRT